MRSLIDRWRGDDGGDGIGMKLFCFLLLQNVGSVRAVITMHYQAKGKLRIVRIRCVVSGNKEIMVTYRMFRSRGIGVAKLVSDVSMPHMAKTFSS